MFNGNIELIIKKVGRAVVFRSAPDAFAPIECHYLPLFDQGMFIRFTKKRSCEKLSLLNL